MHIFSVIGDPVRRRILELLAAGERPAGAIVDVIRKECGISQAGVSQHLRILREAGFVTVRSEGQRRIYSVDPAPLRDIDAWLEPFRAFWTHRLEALATEVARGKKKRQNARSRKGAAPGKNRQRRSNAS